MLSELDPNHDNLVEILFIRVFLVERLMCLNISVVALKVSKSSGSILINLQPSSGSIAFCIFI